MDNLQEDNRSDVDTVGKESVRVSSGLLCDLNFKSPGSLHSQLSWAQSPLRPRAKWGQNGWHASQEFLLEFINPTRNCDDDGHWTAGAAPRVIQDLILGNIGQSITFTTSWSTIPSDRGHRGNQCNFRNSLIIEYQHQEAHTPPHCCHRVGSRS